MLIIADVHFGKVMHFRKAGIAIPSQIILADLEKLSQLLYDLPVERVLFLGDLFHSYHNSEWALFDEWLGTFPDVSFELVVGNHDIHALPDLPERLVVHESFLQEGPFLFSHEPLEQAHPSLYNISGHLHPAVRMRGDGGSMKLPCFHFGEKQAVLPAFGRFTGTMVVRPKKTDQVFVVAENKVIKVL